MRLGQIGKSVFQQRRSQIEKISVFLSAFRSDRLLQAKRGELTALELRLTRIVSSGVEFRKNRAAELANFVRLLGPQQTLERGYSITLDANGHIIRTMETLEKGDRIQTKLADGVVRSVVDEKVRSEK
jgi:exodeoxyribonuclease VII large subunit